jgi:anti-sigma regulatory factor (Ser/Thr protein kinase)
VTLGNLAENDTDHAADIAVIVSELVTNAITHVAGIRNVWLEIEVWPRWTRVIVDDRDPTVHPPDEAVAADPLPESLRGLLIVRALSERFWWRTRALSKAAHAVVLHSGIELAAVDRDLLDALEHSEGERLRVVR